MHLGSVAPTGPAGMAAGGRRQDWAQQPGSLGTWARRTGERPELRAAAHHEARGGLSGGVTTRRPRCSECGGEDGREGKGRYGLDAHEGLFFCGACWQKWQVCTGSQPGAQTITTEELQELNEELLRGCDEMAGTAGQRPPLMLRRLLEAGGAFFAAISGPSSDGLRAGGVQLVEATAEAAELLMEAERLLEEGRAAEALLAAGAAREACWRAKDQAGTASAVRIAVRAHCLQDAFKEATSLAEEQMVLFRSASSAVGEAAMLLSLAEVKAAETGPKDGLDLAGRARDLSGKAEDMRMQAVASLVLARLYLAAEAAKQAVEVGDQAYTQFEELGDRWGRAHALRILAEGLPASNPGDAEAVAAARRASQGALALFREIGDRRSEASELARLAEVRLERGKPQDALRAAERAATACRELGDGRGEVATLHVAVRAHLALHDGASALEWAKEAAAYFRSWGDGLREAQALEAQLLVQHSELRFGEALATAHRAAELCRSLHAYRWEACMLDNAARVYLRCQRVQDSLGEVKRALAVSQNVGDVLGEAAINQTLSRARSMLGQHQESLTIAATALQLLKGKGRLRMEAGLLLEVAYARAWLGELQHAGDEAAKAKSLFQQCGDQRNEAVAWLVLADIHLPNHKLEAAKWAVKNASDLAKELGDTRMLAEASKLGLQAEQLKSKEKPALYPGLAPAAPLGGELRAPAEEPASGKSPRVDDDGSSLAPEKVLLLQLFPELQAIDLVGLFRAAPEAEEAFSAAQQRAHRDARVAAQPSNAAGTRCAVCGTQLQQVGLAEVVAEAGPEGPAGAADPASADDVALASGDLLWACPLDPCRLALALGCGWRQLAVRRAVGTRRELEVAAKVGLAALSVGVRSFEGSRFQCAVAELNARVGLLDVSALVYRRLLAAAPGHLQGALGLHFVQRRCGIAAASDDALPALREALRNLGTAPWNALERAALTFCLGDFSTSRREVAEARRHLAEQQLGTASQLCWTSEGALGERPCARINAEGLLPILELRLAADGSSRPGRGAPQLPSLLQLRDTVDAFVEGRALQDTSSWFLKPGPGMDQSAQEFRCKAWALAGVVREAMASMLRSKHCPADGWLLQPAVRPWLAQGGLNVSLRAYVLVCKLRGKARVQAWLCQEVVVSFAAKPWTEGMEVGAIRPADASALGRLGLLEESSAWQPQIKTAAAAFVGALEPKWLAEAGDKADVWLLGLDFLPDAGGTAWLVEAEVAPPLWAAKAMRTAGGREVWGPQEAPGRCAEGITMLEEALTRPLLCDMIDLFLATWAGSGIETLALQLLIELTG